jgi:outer membrane protein, heavy metal efflux system
MNRTALLLCLLALPACDAAFAPPARPQPVAATRPAAAPATPQAHQPDLPDPLTIEAALAYAWQHHPAMGRARRMIRAKHGLRVQAALWPNPTVMGTLLEEPDRKTQMTVILAQKFEIGGKAGARVSTAAAGIFLSEAELIEVWSDLRADVKEAFLRLAYARQQRALAEQIARTDRERLDLAAGLFKAGKASEAQTLQITQQAARSRTTFEQSASRVEDASRQVLAAIGRLPDGEAHEVDCALHVKSPLAEEFIELLSTVNENNPQLATARAQTAVASARWRLARTKRWSDVTVGLGYRRTDYDTGDDGHGVLLEASMPLTVWDRNQGNIAAAREEIRASRREQEAAALIAARQLSDLFSQRQRWRMEREALDKRILPAAERELVLAEKSEAGGKVPKLDVLKLSREATVLRLRQLEVQLLEAVATVQLEKIAGVAGHDPSGS